MRQKIVFNKADDFFRIFIDEYGFTENNIGIESKYIMSNQYGIGHMNRFSMNNGIVINIVEMALNKNIQIFYELNSEVFEVVYCLSGHINHFQEGVGNFILEENYFGIMMKDKAEGWMEFPKDTEIKYISVSAYAPFLERFSIKTASYNENDWYVNILVDAILKSKMIYSILKTPFDQINNCCFEGINRLIYLESKAMEIISTVLQNEIAKVQLVDHKNYLKQSDKERIRMAEKTLVKNLSQQLSIKELARVTGLNECKLKTGFREMYGNTIYGYLKASRLEKAKELLTKNSDWNINEIVNEVGYANTGHFAKAFREKYGVNPKNFRRSSRNKK